MQQITEQLRELEKLIVSQPVQASPRLQVLLAQAEKTGDSHTMSYALCLLSGCAFFQGEVTATLEYAQRSCELARQHGFKDLEIRAENAQGLAYWRLGQLAEALFHFQRSLALSGIDDLVGRSRVFNNLACLYVELEDYERAAEHFAEAVELARESGHPDYMTDAMVGLAEIDLEEGQYEAVLQRIPPIRQALSQRPQPRTEFHMRRIVTQALYRLGRYEEALKCGEGTLIQTREIGDAEAEAILHLTLADVYADLGQLTRARAELEQSRELAEQMDYLRLQAKIRYSEARFFALEGEYRRAYEVLGEYSQFKDALAQHNRRLQSQAISGQIQLEVLEREARVERERNIELMSANALLRSTQSELSYRASHDMLTGLLNRAAFWSAAQERLEQRPAHVRAALLFADIDRLKMVNDNYGHAAGDRLIREIGRRIQAQLGERDLIGRLSGDEFMIYLDDLATSGDVGQVARRLLNALAEPLELPEVSLPLYVSFGSVLVPDDGDDITQLHHYADLALYEAKQQGKNTWMPFRAEISAVEMRRRQISDGLREALSEAQLELLYQPQFALPDRRLVGAEALLRWQHPTLGWISPAEFIQVAEENAQVVELGQWVLAEACRQAKAWGFEERRLMMSVNVSVRQFERPDFVERVAQVLRESGLSGRHLILELTETLLHRESQTGALTVEALQRLGVRIAIDDFGTGYSSMSLLRQLPFKQLKIDRSFVMDLTRESPNFSAGLHFMKVMVSLAHGLGMRVIAEGVETQEQLDLLTELGCDKAQGYLLASPLSAMDLAERFLNDGSEQE